MAKRSLAKLCLNSFWGNLIESNNRPQSKKIADPQELFRFLTTPGIELISLVFAEDEAVWATWKYVEKEENMPVLRHTNEVIAAYVTTGALLNLCSYLDVLKEKSLYCYTDSVVCIQECGELPAINCGDKLGDMTSDLSPNKYIQEFVCAGPKNYVYRRVNAKIRESKTVCKVRGITLIYAAAQLVKFDSIWDLVLGSDDKEFITVRNETQIKRKMRNWDGIDEAGRHLIPIEPEEKVYRASFHKRL